MTVLAPLDAAAAAQSVWTCDEVAAYFKCSRRKVDYLRKRDDFPRSVALGGGHPRYSAAQVIAWWETQLAAA